MSDERPERPEGEGPRDPDTPAPDPTVAEGVGAADHADAHDVVPSEALVEESDEIDLGEDPRVDEEADASTDAADAADHDEADAEDPAPRRVSRTTAAVQAAGQDPVEEAPADLAADDVDVDDADADQDDLDQDDLDQDDLDQDDLDQDGDHTLVTPAVEDGSPDDTSDDAPAHGSDPDRDAWPFAAASAAPEDDARPYDDGWVPGPTETGEERRRRRWPLVLGVAAVVLGALYVAGWFLTGTRLPADVTVAGVQLGGTSQAEARQRLEDELGPRADDPVRLVSGEESFEVVPDDVGLALDAEGSVDRAGGTRSWDPRDMVALFIGSSEHAPVLDVDEAALESAVQAVAEQVDVPVTEALITFPDAEPTPREPEGGRVVPQDDAAQLVLDEYLVQDEPAEVPLVDVEPVVDAEGLARAVTEIGEPAVSAPVTIQVGDDDVELPVTAYAPALTVKPVDGVMTAVIDAERLAEPLTDATTGIGEQAVDATVDIEDGKPVVVPGKEGVGLQPEEMAELLPPVLTESGDARSVRIEAKVVQPAFTTEDAEKLGITEKIGEFTTQYPHAEYRNVNQARAAALIDGVILEPGETFSFNDTVGERTRANGFTTGSVINGGRFVDELGGGVSQVVTTTYNAAFFAGLEDVEHHPHAFYIDRYPEGREATVYFGSLDLRFKNSLDNGVLIKAFVQKSAPGGVGRTTVQMWGTKQFDVEAGKSERRNERSPRTRYDDSDDCVPQAPLGGFDVDIYRTLSQGGKVVKRETDTAVYQAADRIVCGEEPEPDADDQG